MSFTSTVVKLLTARALPSFNPDSANVDVAMRGGSYGEVQTLPVVRKNHTLATEGTYYTANNAQSGLASAYNTSFTSTAPFMTIYNANQTAYVSVDYIALIAIVAGAQTTTAGYIAGAVVVDTGNRYSSGGTALSPVNANLNLGNNSLVSIFAGAVTATAATGAARTLVGVRNLRPSVSTTVINVVGDMNLINFGSVEGATGSIVVANANVMPQAFPPLIIPPVSTALFYITYPVMSAPSAATFAPEVGFWVR